jgi:Spy/CpxP family protein refolding chaperone
MMNRGFFPPMVEPGMIPFIPMDPSVLVEEWKKKLSLSQGQVEKLKTVFEAKAQESKLLRDQLSLDLAALRLLLDKKGTDDSLREALDKISGDQTAIQGSQRDLREKINALLTPRQQAQLIVEMPMGGPPGFGFPGGRGTEERPSRTP